MARYLTQEQISEFRECFNLYDKKRNGFISCSDLCTVMRSLGSIPTLQEVDSHLKFLNKTKKDEMEFSEFLIVIHKQLNNEKPSQEIHAAFKLTDEQSRGLIAASRIKHILMHTGENLTQREVDQMFRAANIQSTGFVRYDEFVRLVTLPLQDY